MVSPSSTSTSSESCVTLHDKQADFIESDAKYRAFIGGVGSGKSYAGAVAALVEADEVGGLGMVIAPTYPMLRDATLRTFKDVVGDLMPVLNRSEMRGEMWNGAEVLFRSADEPDRLRGPNLTWVWLDEAALMHEDIWKIIIGRLRAKDTAGRAWITTTPKGFNWVYDEFGPDAVAASSGEAALFTVATRDNPYLPDEFVDTLERQYVGAFARQELEGAFVALDGSLFKREWFEIVPAAPSDGERVRYWDNAGTEGGGDYTVGVRLLKAEGKFYVEDVVRGQWLAGDRERIKRQTAELDGRAVRVVVEQEPGSSGKDVAAQSIATLAGFWVQAEKVTGDKVTRAQPFAAQCQAGNVKLVAGEWNQDYLREVLSFPDGPHDDQVDASSGAFNKLALYTYAPVVYKDSPYGSRRDSDKASVEKFGTLGAQLARAAAAEERKRRATEARERQR